MSLGTKWLFALFLTVIIILPNRSVATPGDQNWDEHFILPPGVNGEVYGLASRDGNVYVAGDFTKAGSVAATNIARWDGTNWFPLGEGISGHVSSLVFLGTNLYAGGRFDRAGSATATNIARWDGFAWHDLDGGTGPQESFILLPTIFCLSTNDGALYAGGVFQSIGGTAANSIAKWDGTNWTSMGEGVRLIATNNVFGQQITETESGTVFSIAFFHGNLFVGGLFNQAGSVAATNIARWNGTNWSNLGNGVKGGYSGIFAGEPYSGWVYAMESFDGHLYVGGDFTNAGGLAVTNLAKWNGSLWQNADGGFSGGGISCLFSNNRNLFAGGYFKEINGNKIKGVAKWNRGEWHSLSNGINGPVYRISANGSRIVAGGEFGIAGGKSAAFVSQWDGVNWSALGEGEGNSIIGTVMSLAAANEQVYAAGRLSSAGANEASFITRWNGTNWTALDRDFVGSHISSLATESNKLFACGDFCLSNAGITNLAAWDGTNWTGFGVESGTSINLIASSGKNIFASGWFTSIGGVAANSLAVWNGTNWSDIGNSLTTNRMVFNALLVKDNILYAGSFSGLARWDGTNWSKVAGLVGTNGLSLGVESMTLYRGQILITFSSYPDSYLMRWDGTNWSQIIHPFAPGFLQIVGSDTYLYGYGPMTNGNGDVLYNVFKWDGLNWFPLASGLEKPAGNLYGAIMAANKNTLAVAGNFTMAGDKESYHFGIWQEPPLPTLTRPQKLEDGSFTFRLLGSEGQNVEIQFSENLFDWIPFQTNSLNFLPLEVTNVPPENASQGFYRLQQVP